MGSYRNMCLPGLVKIRRIVLKIFGPKEFLCLCQFRLAGGTMFSTCPSVRSFVRYQTFEHGILKTNKLILLEIGTSAPRTRAWNDQLLASRGQRSGSHDAKVRSGDLAEVSRPIYFGAVWSWPLTSWPKRLCFMPLLRIDRLRQLASKSVHSLSEPRAHNFVKPLMGTGNYSAASNNMKLVHWPLMGGLLRLPQRWETGRGPSPPRPLIAVPNVTAHPSTASVPITVLLYDGPLLCGSNVLIKGLTVAKNERNEGRMNGQPDNIMPPPSGHCGLADAYKYYDWDI